MQAKKSFRTLSPVAALLPLLAATAMPADAAGWASTHTHAYVVKGLKDAGLLPDAAPMHIAVSLKLRNRDQLDEFLGHVTKPGDGLYGHYLSSEQFVSRYAPSEADAQAVVAYLQSAGFKNIEVAPNRLLVTADGSARAARTAFKTELKQYDYAGRRVFSNVKDAQVPAHLSGVVLSVLGLQNIDLPHTMNVVADGRVGTNATHGYNPTAFPAAYGVGNVPAASQATVGIITAGDISSTLTDLSTFESQNSLPRVPVTSVYVGTRGTDTSGVVEWDLDSQDILGMAGNLKALYFYVGNSLSTAALSQTYNRAVTDNIAKVVNVSLGICERSSYTSGELSSDDQIFAQGMAQGQTFTVSSGDGGARTGCYGHTGFAVQVSYPASSPYVTAVGGTTLQTTAAGAYSSESAWSGGGGGVSKYERIPSWQKTAYSGTYRSVPDVALAADPASGAIITVGLRSEQVGGTSLAAPLFAGVWARVLSSDGNAVGFAPSKIYPLYTRTPSPFHDVTTGNNGYYSAAKGFDQTTGLGSPVISTLVGDL